MKLQAPFPTVKRQAKQSRKPPPRRTSSVEEKAWSDVRHTTVALGICALIAYAGMFACWGPWAPAGSASGQAAIASDRTAPRLAWNAPLPLLPEDKPRSIRYRQATLRWRTATVAFARGQFPDAATRFLQVAHVLKTERPHPHASTFATARCLAYENAGRALSMLADQGAAHRKLLTATDDDPACPRAVRRAFRSLSVDL